MRLLQFLRARRMVFSLGLLGFLGLTSGCSDSDPVASMGTEEAAAKGKLQAEAREKAFGKGGVPKLEKGVKKN
jgi:hypothetical protein